MYPEVQIKENCMKVTIREKDGHGKFVKLPKPKSKSSSGSYRYDVNDVKKPTKRRSRSNQCGNKGKMEHEENRRDQ